MSNILNNELVQNSLRYVGSVLYQQRNGFRVATSGTNADGRLLKSFTLFHFVYIPAFVCRREGVQQVDNCFLVPRLCCNVEYGIFHGIAA